jgi:hypothetical protein
MLPSVTERFIDGNFVFQQDNCPIHTSRIVQDWLRVNNIDVLELPSRTPDLNHVENVVWWRKFVNGIWFTETGKNWIELNEEHVKNAVESMNRRLINVIKINGATTKY